MPGWPERVRYSSHPRDPRVPEGTIGYVESSLGQPVMGPFHPSVNYEQQPMFYDQGPSVMGPFHPSVKYEPQPIPQSINFLGLEKQYQDPFVGTKLESFSSQLPPYLYRIIGNRLFKRAYQSAYGDMSPSKKFEYGIKFTPLGKKPVSEWKYYEGASEYFSKLSTKEIESHIDRYLAETGGKIPVKGFRVTHDISRAFFPESAEDVTLGAGSTYVQQEERPDPGRIKMCILRR